VYAENHCKSLIVNRSLFLQLYDDTTDIGRARAFGGTLLVLGTFQMATSLKTIKAGTSGRLFDSGKNLKTEKSNLHGFELHRPFSKGGKLLFSSNKSNRQSSTLSPLGKITSDKATLSKS